MDMGTVGLVVVALVGLIVLIMLMNMIRVVREYEASVRYGSARSTRAFATRRCSPALPPPAPAFWPYPDLPDMDPTFLRWIYASWWICRTPVLQIHRRT